mgnify:CR=1 FL=1
MILIFLHKVITDKDDRKQTLQFLSIRRNDRFPNEMAEPFESDKYNSLQKYKYRDLQVQAEYMVLPIRLLGHSILQKALRIR